MRGLPHLISRRGRARALPLLLSVVAGITGPAGAETLVAVALPPGEPHRAIAAEIRAGVEDAARGLAAQNGAEATPLLIRAFEAECSPEPAARAAAAIVAARPALVIGHPCAAGAIAAAPIYAKAGIPFFAIAVRHAALTLRNGASLTFRMAGRDDRQGAEAGAWLADRAGDAPALIVHDRTAGARQLAEAAGAEFARRTNRAANVIGIVTGGKEYGEVALLASRSGAAALYFTGYPAEGRVVIGNLRNAGWRGPVLLHDGAATDELARVSATTGDLMVLLPADHPTPRAAAAAAVEAWAAASATSGGVQVEGLAATLRGGVKTRALGHIAFDENGDLLGPSFRPHVATGGRWQPAP